MGEEGSFYSGDERLGDLIVDSFDTRIYDGVDRSVAIVNPSRNGGTSIFVYDVYLGVLVEYQRFEEGYSIEVKLQETNLWDSRILGLEPFYFYFIIIVILLFIGLTVFFTLRKRIFRS